MGGPPPLPTIEGQTYCLRWNNHKSNLVEILDALIKVESYVDCTIVVDDQIQFKAHRVVLAANSPYFQAILQGVPMDHCSIIFPGVKAFEMRALLEYMYTGEVNVTQSQIPKIMRIAEELEVKGLFDMADLKEKFNKMSEEHAERAGNPYTSSAATTSAASAPPYTAMTATSSSSLELSAPQNGAKEQSDQLQHHQQQQSHHHHHHQNSSSVISTSSNISPSAAPTSSSSSPPYGSYKSPYSNLYAKSPGPSTTPTATQSSTTVSAQMSTHVQSQQTSSERGQWPLSPSVAAAAMLSSVYESAPDMNPLKRKKLSSISSMLMNRDTPILRNVLAQANPADSSQAMPLLLPGASKTEKSTLPSSAEKASPHTAVASATSGHNNHSFNGSDYSSDKKYQEEPHSPFTDRSFEDEAFDPKGNFAGSFGASAANQKPEWKRYKQYTRNDIMSAIQCVRDGMSALQASRKFGVPSRTLYDKVKKLGITTGRPMNRTMKRSPSTVDSSAAFPYAHGYGQPEPLLSSMHEGRDEREPKEHHRGEHHHMPTTIPHPAAALLDHAFLQQALENRGGDIAGREALHAMALAAAAHAAANRMSTSPGPNGTAARSPSPTFAMRYARQQSEHEILLEREKERRIIIENEMERERERERDADDEEEDHVEDLSVARKDSMSPPESQAPPPEIKRSHSPYSPPPPPPASLSRPASTDVGAGESGNAAGGSCSGGGVIMAPMSAKLPASSADDLMGDTVLKREILSDDGRAD